MGTLDSQGTTLMIGDGESPETFAEVGEITSIGGPSGSASVRNITNLSSVAVEKKMGLPDEGQVSLGLFFDPDDTEQTAMREARTNRELTNFKIVCSDSPATELSFSAYVLEFSNAFEVDQEVTVTATLEITGPVTYS